MNGALKLPQVLCLASEKRCQFSSVCREYREKAQLCNSDKEAGRGCQTYYDHELFIQIKMSKKASDKLQA
jgi:hypothetical protein